MDWRLFRRLAAAGVVGGIVGAYILIELPEEPVKMFVTVYLFGMALLIGYRIWKGASGRSRILGPIAVGVAGGFLDAIGGGGWGPMVNSTLIAQGESPRHSIGSISIAEFFVTAAISVTFVMKLDLTTYGKVVLGLIIGGALAAPFAGWFSRVLPQKVLMVLVALVVAGLAVYNFIQLGKAKRPQTLRRSCLLDGSRHKAGMVALAACSGDYSLAKGLPLGTQGADHVGEVALFGWWPSRNSAGAASGP